MEFLVFMGKSRHAESQILSTEKNIILIVLYWVSCKIIIISALSPNKYVHNWLGQACWNIPVGANFFEQYNFFFSSDNLSTIY